MGRMFFVVNLKKLAGVVFIIGVVLTAACILSVYVIAGIQPVSNTYGDELHELAYQNKVLNGVVSSILPEDGKVLYEEDCRPFAPSAPASVPKTAAEVMEKGVKLSFRKLMDNPEYQRPLYDPSWKYTYFRSWIYLPYKLCEARHRLFVYQGGLSNIFDFEGSLGFKAGTAVDYQSNINFLVYDFDVKQVQKLDYQIILSGESLRSGAQIVSVAIKDSLPKDVDRAVFLFQLMTEGGYEVDHVIEGYGKSEYYKKLEGLESEDEKTAALRDGEIGDREEQKKLQIENASLKAEAAHFIPLEDELITRQECREGVSYGGGAQQAEIRKVKASGREIAHSVNFGSSGYRRPVYHPVWKQNYLKGWSYLPEKVCDSFHRVFVIPGDMAKREEALGKLAFFEPLKDFGKNEAGLLLYNFQPSTAVKSGNRLVIYGIPKRSGAWVISFKQSDIMTGDNLLISLAAPDNNEIDYIFYNNDLYK